jgi:hypothetical protein
VPPMMATIIIYSNCPYFKDLKFSGFGFVSFENDDPVERLVGEHFVNVNGKQVGIIFFNYV